MRRELFILWVLWFTVGELGLLLFYRFYLGMPLDGEILQTAMLSTLVGSLFFYLFYRLYKIKEAAGIVFMVVGGIAYPLSRFVYGRYFPDTDTRQQLLQVLAVLAVTTAIVHLVGRKSHA